jgi:hypothetical protein
MQFADPFDPTADELRRWASDPEAAYPNEMSQDWDLIVADWKRIDLIVELASDVSPQRPWFLAVLYLMAGDCVRNEAGKINIPQLRALLDRLENTPTQSLRLFRKRALALLADPSSFNYSLWCDGGYVYAPDSVGGG